MNHPVVCMLTGQRHDTPRLYEKEARCLREHGCGVTIFCPDYEGTDSAGIQFVRVDGSGFLGKHRQFSALRSTSADFYYVYGEELLSVAIRLKRFGRVIFEPGNRCPDTVSLKEQARFLKKLYAVIVETPEAYEAYKPFVRRTALLRDYPVEQSYPGIQSPCQNQRETVCTLGLFSKESGFVELLDALGHCGRKLAAAGEFISASFEEEMRSRPSFSQVEYKSFLSGEERRFLLSTAGVGVLAPKAREKEWMEPPGEAFAFLAAGVPLVTSNFYPFSELVEKYNCGVCVDPADSEGISASIEYLLKNPDVAAEMGMNGRKAVEENYNWNSETDKLLSLFHCVR